jgi:predicted amidohydrolase
MRFVLALACTLHAEVLFQQSGFHGVAPAGWTQWSHRPETMPRVFVDSQISRGEPGSLAIGGGSNSASYGGWRRLVTGVKPGEWLRFKAFYRAESVAAENWQVIARLDWSGADGKRVSEPDYLPWTRPQSEWTELGGDAQVPEKAASVTIELYLANAPQGSVWWDDISLERIPPPAPRKIQVASVNLRPRDSRGSEDSVARFVQAIERAAPAGADVILLPEGISVVGTDRSYVDVAEPVPGGPTLKALGAVAKARKAYIVAGIYEREGSAVYNTAVLIDRNGDYAGKYRKVYLPREEMERGLTPGAHFPVFQTDFGKIGLMICYDVFFAEPARALANQGADMILMPIWGGDESLAKARAIENGVFLIASGYDHPTYIMDPYGERLSQAREQGSVAAATIDLGKVYRWQWLGDMRTRRMKELRMDVAVPQPGLLRF